MSALNLVLWPMAYLLAFFYAYILVMGIYRAHLAGRIVKWSRLFWLCLPGIVIGWGMDVLANLLIAPFVFRDVPREWLVTSRLIRYRRTIRTAAGAASGPLPSVMGCWTRLIRPVITADIKNGDH